MSTDAVCPICGAPGGACRHWLNDPEIGRTRGVVFHRLGDEENMVDQSRVEDRRMYRVHDRFYVNADRDTVVAEGSGDARFLLAVPGMLMPLHEAVRYGIADNDGNPLDPLAADGEDAVVEESTGTRTRKREIETLDDIKGVGEATSAALREAGIETPADLLAADNDTLLALDVPAMTEGKIADWKRQVQEDMGAVNDEVAPGAAEGDEATGESDAVEPGDTGDSEGSEDEPGDAEDE